MTGDIGVRVLAAGAEDPAFVERAYHEVLAPSFGDDELSPVDEFVADATGLALVVATRGDELLAAAVADHEAPLGLLHYLAVRPGLRGAGVGSTMMAALTELWASGPAEVVLGEVHDPRVWAEQEDEQPAARLRFYERNGARLLMAPWVQPRITPTGDRVAGMLLLAMWSRRPVTTVPAAWVRDWMEASYFFGEGLGATSGDPTLDALLGRVGSDQVEVRDVADLADLALLEVPPS